MSKFVRSVGFVLVLLLAFATGARPVEAQFGGGGPGQQPAVRFERLSMAEGLSSSSVTSLVQDDLGFIWIGTQGGLNKYDGHNFTVYKQDPDDPGSLRDNFTESLYVDGAGALWVGTQDGWLAKYDRPTDSFVHHDVGVHVLAMLDDSAGTFWIATQEPGLLHFDRESGETTVVWPDKRFVAMGEDGAGDVWLVDRDGGLVKYDRTRGQFIEIKVDRPISQLHSDPNGALWLATRDGAFGRYDRPAGDFIFQQLEAGAAAPASSWISDIHESRSGDLWLGTGGGGLYHLAADGSAGFTHYRHDPADPHSLASDNIVFVYEDRSGAVWAGNAFDGLSKLAAGAARFGHYRPRPDEDNSLKVQTVTGLHEDQDGVVWIGGFVGLDRWDRWSGQWRNFRHDPGDPGSLSSNEVRSVYVDSGNTVWVGSEGGLDRYEREQDRFVHYDVPAVMWMLEDRAGTFWLATKGGLYQLDRESGRAELVREGWAWKIFLYEDREGLIWVGTSGDGLERFDPKSGEWRAFPHDSDDLSGLGHHSVNALCEDQSGALWIATGAGLNRFDRMTETFGRWSEKDGLPDSWISGLLLDDQGQLWLSTGAGLSRFDPETETFTNYGLSDGIQAFFFWRNAQHHNPAGELFFGGTNGFNVFRPDEVSANPQPPPVVLTAVGLFDDVLRTDPGPGEQIELDHTENFLSFDFAALDYNAPEQNQYAYMMEGLDQEWIYAGARRHADYPDLKPGDYTFRVKGANADGVWNEEGTSLSITIWPPFWSTWWFRGLVVLALAGVAFGGYWLRVRSLEARSRDLARQVEARTAELSATNVRLEEEMEERRRAEEALAQERTEAAVAAERNRLARDLHDSVTQSLYSLTLFAEATRHAAEAQGDREVERQSSQIGRIAQQALKEMRLLVYELRPLELEQAGLVRALRQRLEAVEGRAGIEGRVVVEDSRGAPAALPPEIEQQLYYIAQEALNNALKHASAGSVTVYLRLSAGQVELEVVDDGQGFDPESLPDQAGMGLANIRERAWKMGGTAIIHSAHDAGTQIKVTANLGQNSGQSGGGEGDG
ncbi:MAG TPA: two-component regulator propeller domain-containing protein [Anaerolineae bacterium]|nr:two-component regulator propeller domain-containing protein [Anaerolineae bacterium]